MNRLKYTEGNPELDCLFDAKGASIPSLKDILFEDLSRLQRDKINNLAAEYMRAHDVFTKVETHQAYAVKLNAWVDDKMAETLELTPARRSSLIAGEISDFSLKELFLILFRLGGVAKVTAR